MSKDLVLVERDGDVATLTFNDPDRRNAMTEAMGVAFSREVALLGRDEGLRAVVLTGAGRAFSAGGDLDMIQTRADEGKAEPGIARRAIRDTMRSFYKLFLSVRDLPCPTVAAVNGHAVGAGLCVALACDLRLVSREAKLGLNFTKLGLQPGMGATWTLPRLVGSARAAELLYTSRLIGGEEAAAIGMASRALDPAEVLPEARALAAEIALCAPLAVRGVKQSLARSAGATLEDQLSFEAAVQAACFESADVHEGLAAARERRDPEFAGR
ncbi:MAG: enoyl-CoA hydratase/isomerase family protein [Myxococcota bacterium]